MARSAIYNRYPKLLVDMAFEKYPEEFEVVQYGPCLDHTGENMEDYVEDVNERPRIAYIKGFLDGTNAMIRLTEDKINESDR